MMVKYWATFTGRLLLKFIGIKRTKSTTVYIWLDKIKLGSGALLHCALSNSAHSGTKKPEGNKKIWSSAFACDKLCDLLDPAQETLKVTGKLCGCSAVSLADCNPSRAGVSE